MTTNDIGTRLKYNRNASHYDLMELFPEALGFESDSFDSIAATFVFCSVPDPIQGLTEVRRVLKPEGKFYALEHVRPNGRILGALFDRFAPAIAARSGVHINRNTVDTIKNAGFEVEEDRNLLFAILKMIVARPFK